MTTNKNKRRKQRLKRQLKKASKPVTKKVTVTTPKPATIDRNTLYQIALTEKYKGTVTVKERILNPNASLIHHCSICDTSFWGKPSHMLGEDHQKHICTLPYGTAKGERLLGVSKVQKKRNKKKNKDNVAEQLYQMIIEDYTYKEIAKELKLNPDLVKDHFIKEGLI